MSSDREIARSLQEQGRLVLPAKITEARRSACQKIRMAMLTAGMHPPKEDTDLLRAMRLADAWAEANRTRTVSYAQVSFWLEHATEIDAQAVVLVRDGREEEIEPRYIKDLTALPAELARLQLRRIEVLQVITRR